MPATVPGALMAKIAETAMADVLFMAYPGARNRCGIQLTLRMYVAPCRKNLRPGATRDAVTASSRDACHLYAAGRLLFWGGAVLQRCVKRENHHSRREDRLWLRC